MDREESIFCEMRAENSCKIRVLVLLLQVRVFVLLLQVDGCACVPDMCRRGGRRPPGLPEGTRNPLCVAAVEGEEKK